MLETMQERVKLLKSGISGKRIEYLYVTGNDMKIINSNLLYTVEESPIVPTWDIRKGDSK
jgi:hypothetical protein